MKKPRGVDKQFSEDDCQTLRGEPATPFRPLRKPSLCSREGTCLTCKLPLSILSVAANLTSLECFFISPLVNTFHQSSNKKFSCSHTSSIESFLFSMSPAFMLVEVLITSPLDYPKRLLPGLPILVSSLLSTSIRRIHLRLTC